MRREDSLAYALLRRMGLPTEPVISDSRSSSGRSNQGGDGSSVKVRRTADGGYGKAKVEDTSLKGT